MTGERCLADFPMYVRLRSCLNLVGMRETDFCCLPLGHLYRCTTGADLRDFNVSPYRLGAQ